ncbi:MAG: hypothetical protein HYT50_00480 [Candidatus Wildermuthbacteria bacterium]|nr:hypothetical protein [Candidatus Wildermuthbacteria bacterium]
MSKTIKRKVARHLVAICMFGVAGLLLHEVQKGVPMFQLSDITAPRPTHEKFVLLFLLGGLYIQSKKKHAEAK